MGIHDRIHNHDDIGRSSRLIIDTKKTSVTRTEVNMKTNYILELLTIIIFSSAVAAVSASPPNVSGSLTS